MTWHEIITAILLETLFKDWCGEHYELFRNGGTFSTGHTARELFIEQQALAAIERDMFNPSIN